MDECMRSAGVSARRRPRGGDDPTRHGFASASPGHQLPVPAIPPSPAASRQTWDRLWPELGTHARLPEGPAGLLDTQNWFGRSAPVVLEIGSGTGTSTLAMAQAEPHIDVVAVEVYRRGLAQLLSAIAREGVTNIRLVRGDGVDVLEHMFGPDSLTGVRVFFPDPWPKARHHKRRLLQPDTRRPDRRPAAARRCVARRHGPRRVRRTDRRVRRRRTPAAARVTAEPTRPAHLGGAADHQVRDEGARRGQRGRGTALGEAAGMSITEEIIEAPQLAPGTPGSCWSGTHPTSTWVSGPSSAAGRPPRTGPDSTRSAAGCWPAPRNCPPGRTSVSLEPEATVFTNIAPGSADVVRPWVEALRNVGFAVFAKPKIDEDSDVDVDMLNHIALRRSEGLAGVLVASADGQAFRQPLEDIARAGIPVQVLGFREHASWALASDTLEFVDLEDIPGVFREPLPRIGLDSLPEQGAWLQPFRPLSSLLTSRV